MRVPRAAMTIGRALLLVITLTVYANAQSLDLSVPTPVPTNVLAGRIAARDIGDARFTDHFYRFAGNPGDFLITVESRNLNGDVDVFTASGLRPLLKVTIYAESTASVSKSIFLRYRQELILRVQARTPNDDEGVYQIRFGGSFEPVAGAPPLEETEEDISSATAATPKRGRRVSSVGARINEPEPPAQELAAAPTPEPTPEAKPAETTPAARTAEETKPAEVEAAMPSSPRSTRTRRPSGRRSTSRTRTPERPAETTIPRGEAERETAESATRSSSRRRGSSRKETTPSERSKPAEQEVPAGPQLIIETLDGTLINRPMSSLRRVLVEAGLVVIVAKDGRVQRVPLSQIVRMSIAP